MLWLSVIVFIILLLGLVLVHEWGHFIVAKKAGCTVEEFGFGFPPRLLAVFWRGTTYSLNALPLGGFVKIEGEDMLDEKPEQTSFASKSAAWRILILSAGVMMNVVLAWVLLTVQSVLGSPTLVTEQNEEQLKDIQTYVIGVAPNSPAAESGFQELDRIIRIGNIMRPSITEIRQMSEIKAGSELEIVIQRQGRDETIKLTPRSEPPVNEGPLGINLASTGLATYPWWIAPWEGLKKTFNVLVAILVQIVIVISSLIRGGNVSGDIAGPVGIAVLANQVTQLGLVYILEFGALISLNLAIINILPFPALDGGRIVFVMIEKMRGGKRLAARFEQYVHLAGFALLILLMIIITFRDIGRYF